MRPFFLPYIVERCLTYTLPKEAGRDQRRYLRDLRRAAGADIALISAGKSGRTWLRFMLSRIWQRRHGLPDTLLVDYDNYHRIVPAVPVVLFTHGYHRGARIVTDPADTIAALGRSESQVFLYRDPRDVVVSAHFELTRRDRRQADDDLATFMWDKDRGLPANVAFLNAMDQVADALPSMLPVAYEAMRADPAAELRRVAAHIGLDASGSEIAAAVADGAFDNMRRLERDRAVDGHFLGARDASDPDSFKVRRGKVGGYRDYFDDAAVAAIDAYVAGNLSARYPYARR